MIWLWDLNSADWDLPLEKKNLYSNPGFDAKPYKCKVLAQFCPLFFVLKAERSWPSRHQRYVAQICPSEIEKLVIVLIQGILCGSVTWNLKKASSYHHCRDSQDSVTFSLQGFSMGPWAKSPPVLIPPSIDWSVLYQPIAAFCPMCSVLALPLLQQSLCKNPPVSAAVTATRQEQAHSLWRSLKSLRMGGAEGKLKSYGMIQA